MVLSGYYRATRPANFKYYVISRPQLSMAMREAPFYYQFCLYYRATRPAHFKYYVISRTQLSMAMREAPFYYSFACITNAAQRQNMYDTNLYSARAHRHGAGACGGTLIPIHFIDFRI